MAAETVSRKLIHEALSLLAALHGEDAQRRHEAEQASSDWRGRSPERERAWLEAEQRWTAVQTLLPGLRGEIAIDPSLPASRSRRELLRRTARTAGVLGVMGLLFGGGRWWWTRPVYETNLMTARARHLPLQRLADGSRIGLAADSAMHVTYWRDRREVVMDHGHAFFEVARDENRPFVVHTRIGQVRVLGTAFSVIDRGGCMQVAVEHGKVEVTPMPAAATLPAAGVELLAGQRVSVDEDGQVSAIQTGDSSLGNVRAWQDGWWVFSASRLADVAREVNAYVDPPLAVDADIESLRLTGSFRIARPNDLLDSLPHVLPVNVRQQDGRWRISRR